MLDKEPRRIKSKRPTVFIKWKEKVLTELQTNNEQPPTPPPPLSSDYQFKTSRSKGKLRETIV